MTMNHAAIRQGRFRLLLVTMAVTISVALAMIGLDAGRSEAQSTLLKGSFGGNAYGTFASANLGQVSANLNKTALRNCPCNGTKGKVLTNTVDTVTAGDVLTSGTILNTVYSDKTTTTAKVRNTSSVQGVNMLGGLITADAIKAVANTSATTTKVDSTANGSSFVNLKVAGEVVRADVAPNTKLDLPGIGSVTLKSVVESGNGKSASIINVDMLVVNVDQTNSLGLPVGAKVVVGHASSRFSRAQLDAVVSGQAYAATTNAAIGKDIQNQVGRQALVTIGCTGTAGRTNEGNVEEISAGDIVYIGTGRTTAFGGATENGTIARTTARVEDVRLLGGIISADAVTAVSQDRFANGVRTSSTRGSQFARLSVAGVPVAADVAPNTRLDLPLLGYVIVNEQTVPSSTSRARTTVNGLHIYVTTSNSLGLPVGSEVIVAHADSSATKF